MSSNTGPGAVPPMAALDTMVAGVAGLVDSLSGGAVGDLTHDQLAELVIEVRRVSVPGWSR